MHFKKLLPINKKTDYYKKNKESKETKNKNKNNDIKVDRAMPRTILDSDDIILTNDLDFTAVQYFDKKEQDSDYCGSVRSYPYTSYYQKGVHKHIPFINSQYLPFGDGSNKVFGYENFGNTCYCNSILQCLFYLDSFRISILSFPLSLTHSFMGHNNNTNKNNNNGTINTIRRYRKRRMDGMKKRYFTPESFQPIVKEKQKVLNQNDKQMNCVELNKRTKITKERSVKNNINDNILDQNQTKQSSFNIFSKHKKSKSLSPETYQGKILNNKSVTKDPGANMSMDDIGPIHSNVMKADYATEKLHEGCQRIIVGRHNCFTAVSTGSSLTVTPSVSEIHSESKILTSSSSLKTSNPNIEKLLNNNQAVLLKDDNNIDDSNFLVGTFTSEKRKKSALIHGPILNIDYMVNVSAKPNIYNGLKDIFECITENDKLTGIVSPLQFIQILKKENILFRTSSQQDAHELLNFILNDIDDYLKTVNHEGSAGYIPANFISFIHDQFEGFMKSTTKCLTCDTKTSNIEPFLDFPIELINEDQSMDIQDLFNDYKQSEFLRGSNKFYCNQCNSLQEAERSVTIDMLPPILILHLKRFEYSEELRTNVKLFNEIVYPLILDVSSNGNCENKVNKRYELTSVVVHMGVSPRHGHYISLCKSSQYGWLLFDDETVESVGESTVLKFIGDKNDQTTAYVLFYKELFGNDLNHDDGFQPGGISNDHVEEIVSISDIVPQNKNEYEKRIDNLIKDDDHIRDLEKKKQQGLNERLNHNEINGIEVQHLTGCIPERDSKSISSLNNNKLDKDKSTYKTNKRKSLLGSFIMK